MLSMEELLPLNAEEYPAVKFWYKQCHNENARRRTFPNDGKHFLLVFLGRRWLIRLVSDGEVL